MARPFTIVSRLALGRGVHCRTRSNSGFTLGLLACIVVCSVVICSGLWRLISNESLICSPYSFEAFPPITRLSVGFIGVACPGELDKFGSNCGWRGTVIETQLLEWVKERGRHHYQRQNAS